ncbi:DegT/DnrJ/EryC1/StrS family aminotransferase [Flavobacterium sp. SM2513]|uniref:DegT/DnrJ/EryC1/StrS family aminotransferase n=1 Tax=Flavobacterium sp. SM2513 TaxID=3424766 RepID=UPI003D7FA10A
MIPITKCFLPPIELYTEWVQKAYDKQWLTNRGELVQLLEERLKGYLDVDWMTVTNNGTIPLQIALKLLGKGGEIITTPFSYVATTAAIVWENCTPVFVDIHPEYLTIDETKIEAAITNKTTCILATHVFGNPCAVEAIEAIAKKHNLYVIYDAAHAFGVRHDEQSIFNYGDVSTCSFHATKLFHTGEGGAMFAKDAQLQQQMYYSHNFGHKGPLDFHGLGINGKISELHAAMGLAVFESMDVIIAARKVVVDGYDALLDFTKIEKMKLRAGTEWNYSYYPVLFRTEADLLDTLERLKANAIYPRRYFNPSLNTVPYVQGAVMPVSESVARRVLCLPLYVGLEHIDLENISKIINSYK